MTGEANMAYDRDLLRRVEAGEAPTVRIFRWSEPTVSFGRLQNADAVAAQVPTGWKSVRRPTGGGVVFHEQDLCLSLCWRNGQDPLPHRLTEQYRWIHQLIQEALHALAPLRLLRCEEASPSQDPHASRACFRNPVGMDLLQGATKIVGGALCRRRYATLYQGSIHLPGATDALLLETFQRRLSPQ